MLIDFDLSLEEFREEFKRDIISEHASENYTTLILEDDAIPRMFLANSDEIAVYDNASNSLVAWIERRPLTEFNRFTAWTTKLRTKRLIKKMPPAFEVYLNVGGDFFEVQVYRRWWYDIARNVHSVAGKRVSADDL